MSTSPNVFAIVDARINGGPINRLNRFRREKHVQHDRLKENFLAANRVINIFALLLKDGAGNYSPGGY